MSAISGNRIGAVVFDMDGVLVDTEIVSVGIVDSFFREHGVALPQEALYATVGASGKGHWRAVRAFAPPSWEYESYIKNYREYYDKTMVDYAKYRNPGAVELLGYLHANGYRIALASSTRRKRIGLILESCGIAHYFEEIMSGEDFKESKPNPEIYVRTVEKLGLLPERCVAIEDSKYGIRAALDAGLTVIAKREERFGFDQSRAHFIVDELLEVVPILEKANA